MSKLLDNMIYVTAIIILEQWLVFTIEEHYEHEDVISERQTYFSNHILIKENSNYIVYLDIYLGTQYNYSLNFTIYLFTII